MDPNIHPVPGIAVPPNGWVWIRVGPVTWGCRAILDERGKKPLLDIVWDRCGWVGGTQEERVALAKKINAALPNVRRMVAKGEIPSDVKGEEKIRGITFKWYERGGYLWLAAGEV